MDAEIYSSALQSRLDVQIWVDVIQEMIIANVNPQGPNRLANETRHK
jgi:hypothetical protein